MAMAASAALLRSDADPKDGRTRTVLSPTLAEEAVAGYGAWHARTVQTYADRFGVPERLADLIYDTALEERIDPDVAFRLVRVESSFRAGVVGPAGAVGLAQVRPSTARWLDSTVTRDHLFEAETNLRLGFRYLRMLLGRYRHDMRLALLAYNRGPGTVAAILALGQDPANGYASRVLGLDPPALTPTPGPAPNEGDRSGQQTAPSAGARSAASGSPGSPSRGPAS